MKGVFQNFYCDNGIRWVSLVRQGDTHVCNRYKSLQRCWQRVKCRSIIPCRYSEIHISIVIQEELIQLYWWGSHKDRDIQRQRYACMGSNTISSIEICVDIPKFMQKKYNIVHSIERQCILQRCRDIHLEGLGIEFIYANV